MIRHFGYKQIYSPPKENKLADNLEAIAKVPCPLKIDHLSKETRGCVTLCGLAIYMKKYLLRQKKNYGKLKHFFHHAKI
jgi:hypothetical protein